MCKYGAISDPYLDTFHAVIITVDGSLYERPRSSKTIECRIDYFVNQYLKALLLATNAPGRSAYDRAEQRMVKFSKELSGVILRRDHCGSHLNTKGETTDVQIEIKNFAFAGEILVEIWPGFYNRWSSSFSRVCF